MKTKVYFLALFLFAGITVAQAQRGVRVGYIDMDYILENVPEYKYPIGSAGRHNLAKAKRSG